MTIEEFRELGWKAGMRVKCAENDILSYCIANVYLRDLYIEGEKPAS